MKRGPFHQDETGKKTCAHRESANAAAHGGVDDKVVLHGEEVAVFAGRLVALLARVRSRAAQHVAAVLNDHAVRLHRLARKQAPPVDARLRSQPPQPPQNVYTICILAMEREPMLLRPELAM